MSLQQQISEEYSQFTSDNIDIWIKDTIYKETILTAKAANLPAGFVSSIRIEKKGTLNYVLVNDWQKDGEPLAIFFNYGTVDHYIQPKPGGTLTFSGEGSHGSAIHFKSSQKKDHSGTTKFSKGHYVSGLPKTEAMENGYRIGQQKLQKRIAKEYKKFSSSISAKHKDNPEYHKDFCCTMHVAGLPRHPATKEEMMPTPYQLEFVEAVIAAVTNPGSMSDSDWKRLHHMFHILKDVRWDLLKLYCA